MNRLIEVLDANWIATLLSIVFSLYVFLLGIPTLFFQTFLPEEIREIYNKYDLSKGGMAKVRILLNTIFFAVFIFGNHALRFVLDILPETYVYKHLLILIFYFSCLFFLVWFTYKSYRSFEYVVFLRKNSRREALKSLVIDLQNYYDEYGVISTDHIDDLAELSNSYCSVTNKGIMINGLYDLINSIITNKKHTYDGSQLEGLLQEVLINCVINSKDFNVEKSYIQVVRLIELITNAQTMPGLNSYDEAKTIVLIKRVAILAIDNSFIPIFAKMVRFLKLFLSTEDELFELFQRAYDLREYSVLSNEIIDLTRLVSVNVSNISQYFKHNLLAYLAWYVSEGNSTKKFALAKINVLVSTNSLSEEDWVNAYDNFYYTSQFDTANMIYNFINPSTSS